MTDQEIQEWKDRIDKMTQIEMARLWRFASVGHPLFVSGTEVSDYFDVRFKKLGGFTPEISKRIGW